MTDFREAYKNVHQSVVGFGWTSGDETHIIGTGFVIHSDGSQAIVLTNEHVITDLNNSQPNVGSKCAILFRDSYQPDETGEPVPFTEIVTLPIPNFGLMPDAPAPNALSMPGFDMVAVKSYTKVDLGIAIIDCKECSLSPVQLELDNCPDEGLPVGLLGYPRGLSITPITKVENIQSSPVLQTGTLSAILPNRAAPHNTYLVHIYSSLGCSGSPLFDSTETVFGVVFAIRPERKTHPEQKSQILSSQLLAVPLTELPTDFRENLKSGKIEELYKFVNRAGSN